MRLEEQAPEKLLAPTVPGACAQAGVTAVPTRWVGKLHLRWHWLKCIEGACLQSGKQIALERVLLWSCPTNF